VCYTRHAKLSCAYPVESAVKISSVSAHPVEHPLTEPFAYSQKWVRRRTALLVKVETDGGLHGWGEVFCFDAWPAIAALIERTYAPLLVGQDPLAVGVLWDRLYTWTRDYGQKGLTVAALSGVDIALWDILGKATGQPVSTLLGGRFRDRVPAYATGLYRTEATLNDVTGLAREAAGYVEQGFTAVKLKVGFGLERDVAAVRAVRGAIGPQTGLMVDANHAYDAAAAIALGRRIAEYDIGWLEEPVPPEDLAGYCAVRRALDIPIAGGEAEFTRFGFRELLRRGAVDIVQPDLCITGGLSEGARIATLAQTFHVRCLPHVWGTGVAMAAALQFIAALPDDPYCLYPTPLMCEYDRTENPLRDHLTTPPVVLSEGCLGIPDCPGLGIDVDEEQLARYRAR